MSLTTDHSRATLGHSHGPAASPQASRAARTRSFDIADFPMPSGREEEWRFSPLGVLRPALQDAAAAGGAALTVEIERAGTPQMAGLPAGCLPRGQALIPADRGAALASAHTSEAAHIQIPAGATLTEPVRISVTGGPDTHAHAHFVVEALEDSEAIVVFEHQGGGVFAGNIEAIVAPRARLTVVSLQLWGDEAVHVGQHEALVGQDATYRHIAVTLGGKAVRLTVNAHYDGERGNAELLGLYFADAGQHHEHQTYINHNTPRCVSRVTYKGALQGAGAHTVWIGDVLIAAAAEGTDTYELNRNLFLTDGTRADSIPNLEIETGEIEGAGHASATGRFDDEQLFYLQSRGVPPELARKLVVRGFFRELIRQIGISDVQDRLMELIEQELQQVEL